MLLAFAINFVKKPWNIFKKCLTSPNYCENDNQINHKVENLNPKLTPTANNLSTLQSSHTLENGFSSSQNTTKIDEIATAAIKNFLIQNSLTALTTKFEGQLIKNTELFIFSYIKRHSNLLQHSNADVLTTLNLKEVKIPISINLKRTLNCVIDKDLLEKTAQNPLSDQHLTTTEQNSMKTEWQTVTGSILTRLKNLEYLKKLIIAAQQQNNIFFLNVSEDMTTSQQNNLQSIVADAVGNILQHFNNLVFSLKCCDTMFLASNFLFNRLVPIFNNPSITSDLSKTNFLNREMNRINNVRIAPFPTFGNDFLLTENASLTNNLDLAKALGVIYHAQAVGQELICESISLNKSQYDESYNFINKVQFATGIIRPELAFVCYKTLDFPLALFTLFKIKHQSLLYPNTIRMVNMDVCSFNKNFEDVVNPNTWLQIIAEDITNPANPIIRFAYYISHDGLNPTKLIPNLTQFIVAKIDLTTPKKQPFILDNLISNNTYAIKLQQCSKTQELPQTIYSWNGYLI